MVDTTLTQLLASNPVTAPLTGEEPIETVVAGISEAAKLSQLSFAPLKSVTSSYTLALADQGKVVTLDVASANNLTIPPNTTAAFPIGATLLVRQIGGGITTIAAGAGVTVQKRSSLTLALAERFSQIVLHKVATNTWHTTGEYLSL